ncbi:sigma-70 family RNA polymerase sigma factor [Actinoplanes sp. NPDC024001]|uniref:sigma-70 family RNA polymerase sigma factor n=1 Tax=Actinoplanes sp. NPDC024001 TaxID=3154598 RepID=UPI0033CEF2DB
MPSDQQVLEARMTAVHADHARALFRFILGLTSGQRQTSEDLTQETMARAWRHVNGLPPTAEETRRWLFTVARRLVIDTVRSRRARPVEIGVVDLTWAATGHDDTADTALATWTVQSAFAQLSETHQDILRDVYLRGEPVERIADRLGVPVGTVKSRTHYALKALRAAMAP